MGKQCSHAEFGDCRENTLHTVKRYFGLLLSLQNLNKPSSDFITQCVRNHNEGLIPFRASRRRISSDNNSVFIEVNLARNIAHIAIFFQIVLADVCPVFTKLLHKPVDIKHFDLIGHMSKQVCDVLFVTSQAFTVSNMEKPIVCIHAVVVFCISFPGHLRLSVMESRRMLQIEALHVSDLE